MCVCACACMCMCVYVCVTCAESSTCSKYDISPVNDVPRPPPHPSPLLPPDRSQHWLHHAPGPCRHSRGHHSTADWATAKTSTGVCQDRAKGLGENWRRRGEEQREAEGGERRGRRRGEGREGGEGRAVSTLRMYVAHYCAC